MNLKIFLDHRGENSVKPEDGIVDGIRFERNLYWSIKLFKHLDSSLLPTTHFNFLQAFYWNQIVNEVQMISRHVIYLILNLRISSVHLFKLKYFSNVLFVFFLILICFFLWYFFTISTIATEKRKHFAHILHEKCAVFSKVWQKSSLDLISLYRLLLKLLDYICDMLLI